MAGDGSSSINGSSSKGKGSDGGVAPTPKDVPSLLKLALKETSDDKLKLVLQEQVAKLSGAAVSTENVAPAEAVKRANSAWKDADHRHTQAVNLVVKLQESLGTAQEREMR